MKIKRHKKLVFELKSTNRTEVRAEVFKHWIAEDPGSPDVSNTYQYDVEKLSDGSVVYLKRPTRLNKGADFIICCQNFTKFKNGNDKPPSHEDLASEIREIIAGSSEKKKELLSALKRIWECENSKQVLDSLVLLKGNSQVERVLLLAKWFFIEQDVTYWTDSGRHMLRSFFEGKFGEFH